MVANPNFDFIQRSGGPPATSSDTTNSAALSLGLLGNPLVFPGSEDPTNNPNRILIGTFTLQGSSANTGR